MILVVIASILLAGSALPALAATPADNVALIIGIDRFQGRTRPNTGAAGDAIDKKELLLRNGWKPENIRMLTNEQATQAAIREGMQWLVDSCRSGAQCAFHYSGHTKQMPAGAERLAEYLWPTDNRFISDAEFASYMRRLNGYAWIDISACEAAGFDNGISGPRTLFTGSSQENEKSYEYPGWQNSVWTGLLINEAIFKGLGNANGDNRVTLEEAFRYARERAPQMTTGQPTAPQNPYMAGGGLEQWFTSDPAPPAPLKTCLLILCF